MRIVNAYSNKEGDIFFVNRSGNNKYIKKVTGYEPYFCIKSKDAYIDYLLELENKDKIRLEVGKTFTKIHCAKYSNVKYIRDNLEDSGIKTYESDIYFVRKYIIDRQLRVGNEQLKYLFLDIETDDTIRKIVIGRDEILSICTMDIEGNKRVFMVPTDNKIEREKKLLTNFLEHIKEYDVLVAWNGGNRHGEGFDFPYIMERVKKHKIKVNWNQWQFIDGMFLYAGGWYKLDKYGEEHLNLKKITHSKTIKEMYDTDKEALIDYNMRDVEIMFEAEKKTGMLMLKDTLSIKANCFIEDLKYNSVIVDTMVLWKVKELGLDLRFPYRKKEERLKLKGGFVLEPVPGLKKGVNVLDFTSLYNRIIQLGLSPECVSSYFKTEEVPTGNNGELSNWIPHYFKYITKNNKKPIIPYILEELEIQRNLYKRKRNEEKYQSEEWHKYDRFQNAVKVILLSFYGVMGLPTSRYYNINMASAITGIARYMIKSTIRKVEELGFKVCYCDTDSVFVELGKRDVNKLIEIGELLTKELNEYYKELTRDMNTKQDKIDIKFEKVYKTILFTGNASGKGTKKRYAGLILAGE